MLDLETKKIIDNARDILVGKLPAPNTQVEQITLAMLYKFMDDIDQESIEMGALRTTSLVHTHNIVGVRF